MAPPIKFGIRIEVDKTNSTSNIKEIGDASVVMAGQVTQAGQAMSAAFSEGAAAVGRTATAVTSMSETEAQATDRIREMVATSMQQNAVLATSAQLLDLSASSTRAAAGEADNHARSLASVISAQNKMMTHPPASAGVNAASSAESEKYVASLQRQFDLLGKNAAEQAAYEARVLGGTKATQAQASAIAANSEQLREMIAAEQRSGQAADAFIAKLKEQTATLGMSKTQLLEYRAAQLGVTAEAAPLIAKLAETGHGAKETGGHMQGMSLNTVAARRELLVLAHELSQGRFTQFAGSIQVLAEQTGAASLLFSAAGLSALALTGAVVGLAIATIKGSIEQKHMNDALIMTNNYAGVTSDGLNNLAHAAVATGGSIGEAKKVVTELAGSGRFTADQIGYITEATVAWEHATGKSVKATIKEFESLAVQTSGSSAKATEAISRATLKLDDQYHFLTEAVYEQIRALEKEGNAKEASALATETFANAVRDRSHEIIENAGSIARAWNGVKEAIGEVVDGLGNVGKRATPASEVDRYKGQLQRFDQGLSESNVRMGRAPDATTPALEETRTRIVTNLTKAVEELNKVDAAAIKQQESTIIQSRGAHAASQLLSEQMHLERKGWTETQTAVAAYGQQLADIAAANPSSELLDPSAVNAHYAAILKAHTAVEKQPKVDRADGIDLSNRIKAFEAEAAAARQHNADLSTLDDMYHRAGELGDERYFANKRKYAADTSAAQIAAYDSELAALAKHNNLTKAETEKTAGEIERISASRAAAVVRTGAEKFKLEEEERIRQEAISQASDDASNKYIANLNEEAEKLESANRGREVSKAAVERETVARLDLAIAYQKQFIVEQAGTNASAAEVAQGAKTLKYLQDVRTARERIAAGLDQQQSDSFLQKAAEQAIKDWERAGQSISTSLASAFGNGGKAVGGIFKAYSEGMAGQLRAQKDLAAAKKLSDTDPKKIDAINRAQADGARAQVQGYGNMATSAQAFFDQGSRGYAAMGTAAKVLQAAEIALSLVKGVNAVLTQGEGDPYSAFARMAAMAAIVAGLGVAIGGFGGGGGGQTAAEVQKKQGTGSVFGDSDAKSNSVTNSLKLLAADSERLIPINQEMLSALRGIESSIGGLTNLVVRTTGLTDGSNLGVKEGLQPLTGAMASISDELKNKTWLGQIAGGLVDSFLGKTTKTIIDSGLQYSGSVRGLQAGSGFSQYASIDTKKSSLFGLVKSTNNTVETQGLNKELSSQFGLIFTNLDKSLQAASVALGGSAADVTKVLDGLTLESTKVSLKGLTGSALTDALNAVISKAMDDISSAAIPGLDKFRAVGEGYAETVVRIASDYANVDAVMQSLGKTFKAVGMASIQAREDFIAAAGGIEQLSKNANDFAQNYMTEAERLVPVKKYVTDQLAQLGLSGITTRAQFREVVMGLDETTAAGAKQFAAMMALEAAFAAVYPAIEATGSAALTTADILSQKQDLQSQLDELMLTSIELEKKKRDQIAASNLPLYDEVQRYLAVNDAKAALKSAYEQEVTAINATVDKMKSLSASLKEFNKSSLLGNLSPLTPQQKYEEARRQYETTLTAAQGGDVTAQANLQNAATAFLTASQTSNASSTQYQSDFMKVQKDTAMMAQWADQQVDVAKASLDALKTQVSGLVDVKTAVLSVVDAIKGLADKLGSGGAGVSNDAMLESLYQSILGRSGDQSGLTFFKNYLSSGGSFATIASGMANSNERHIIDLYKSIKGAAPDHATVELWMDQMRAGMTIDQVAQAMQATSGRVDGSHKDGLARVPYDDYIARLHEDEMVLTASEAEVYRETRARGDLLSAKNQVLRAPRASGIDYNRYGALSMEPLIKEIRELRRANEEMKTELQGLRKDQEEQTDALIAAGYASNDQAADKVAGASVSAARESAWKMKTKPVLS